MSRKSSAFRAVVASLGAASMVVTMASATPAASAETERLGRSAITLADRAGFATVDTARLTRTKEVSAVQLTPTFSVVLKPSATNAVTDGHVTINGVAADGTVVVAQPGGFGVVTNRHARLELRYRTVSSAGTTLVPTGGGLDEMTSSGAVVGHVDPAYAIDSTGTHLAASYGYDAVSHELVVRADTTHAHGAVFIDPSWRCWAVAGFYGAGWILVAAGWIFSGGTLGWVVFVLRAWFGLSLNAANAIARACVS